MGSNKISNFLTLLFSFAGFYLCVISYHPTLMGVSSFMGEAQQEERGLITYLTLGIFLLAISFNFVILTRLIQSYSYIKCYILCILYALLFLPVNADMYFSDVYKISYSFIILLLGLSIPYSSKMLRFYMTIFIILSMYVGYMNIIGLGITFDNFSGRYLMGYKNSLCIIVGVSSLVSLFFAFTTRFYPLIFIYFAFSLLGIIEIAISRGRAALLATLCSMGLVVLKKFLPQIRQNFILAITLFIMFIMIFGVAMFKYDVVEFIKTSFLGAGTYVDYDALSSGRIGLAKQALENFIDNPVLGESYRAVDRLPVHNFWLRILSNYGIIGGLPYLILYVYMWIIVLKGIFFNRTLSVFGIEDIGYYTGALILIASQFEPGFPFGPGTMSAIFFFLLGYTMRNNIHVYPKQYIQSIRCC